jgi:RNA polymerase subunit RPABC4/transcription elongation factor Spt4
MQVTNETPKGFWAEVRFIPLWAWLLALVALAGMQLLFDVVVVRQPNPPPLWAGVLIGAVAGIILACHLLLIGYVNRDARRRGMSPVLWTLLAIFIPNALGLVLYFVLRQPLRSTCPQCGNAVQTGFNYCPRCSYRLGASCPHCQRVVGMDDVYCPYCGTSLQGGQGTA